MPVLFKLLRNNDPHTPTAYHKWFARAVHQETIETEDLAYQIQQNCTLKESDVLAVISELVYTMTHELQQSRRIHLRGFGTFKIGISSVGVDDPDEFVPTRDIKGMHILFYPETHVSSSGYRNQAFLNGAKAKELSHYEKPQKC